MHYCTTNLICFNTSSTFLSFLSIIIRIEIVVILVYDSRNRKIIILVFKSINSSRNIKQIIIGIVIK